VIVPAIAHNGTCANEYFVTDHMWAALKPQWHSSGGNDVRNQEMDPGVQQHPVRSMLRDHNAPGPVTIL